jgi:hypothetical protein
VFGCPPPQGHGLDTGGAAPSVRRMNDVGKSRTHCSRIEPRDGVGRGPQSQTLRVRYWHQRDDCLSWRIGRLIGVKLTL